MAALSHNEIHAFYNSDGFQKVRQSLKDKYDVAFRDENTNAVINKVLGITNCPIEELKNVNNDIPGITSCLLASFNCIHAYCNGGLFKECGIPYNPIIHGNDNEDDELFDKNNKNVGEIRRMDRNAIVEEKYALKKLGFSEEIDFIDQALKNSSRGLG